jgi:hypothetical protein
LWEFREGLKFVIDQLKELVKVRKDRCYEVMVAKVGSILASTSRRTPRFDIPLSLVATIPGTYTAPASRAYLYYTDEYKSWGTGLTVNILPR